MASRFVPSPNLDSILGRLPGVKRARVSAAEAIAQSAAREAPRRTDAYADSLQAVEDGDEVRAETTDPSGHMVEWGSQNNPPYSPIRRGVAAAGYKLEAEDK